MSIEALKRENAELKASNRKLRSEVKLLHAIFDSLSEGVVATNLDGDFLLANPIAQDIAGMGPIEGVPEEWNETYGTFYPDGKTLYPSDELPLYKAMRGEATTDVKMVLRNQNRPAGVFINVSGRPLFDETETLIGGVIVMRDITELERVTSQLETTVNQLQNQNALMDAIFNSISDGVVVVNKAGKYVMFNETAQEMLGYNPQGVRIRQASETFGLFQSDGQGLFPTDELPLAQALRGEHPDNVEILIRNSQMPYGINASISAAPIYNENGAITGAVAVIRDITENKAAENQLVAINDQLTEQSQLLKSIFDNMSDGVCVADETAAIIMANPSAEQIANTLGVPTMVSNEWSHRYHYFYPDKVTPFPVDEMPLPRSIQGDPTDDVELFINTDMVPEGVYVNVSSRPLWNSDGDPTGAVIVFRNVTDKVNRQEAVAQAFVQGRLEIVDTILHNIGNAINSVTIGIETIQNLLADDLLVNRLTAVTEALQQHEDNLGDYIANDPQGQKVLPFLLTLSRDFSASDEKLRQTIERIRNRTGHIVDIIRTQNSYQGTSMTVKDVNLVITISDAIKMLQDSIDKRQIHIEIDCDNAPEEIRIQESQFHQMLVNLIKNSVEAIDELAKSGEFTEIPRIRIHAYTDDEFLCIDITDTGIGIAPEEINKIFSAGFTTKAGGSGLGLHSSANFVISSGGKIQPFSEGTGKGTTIRLMLRRSTISQGTHQE
jgi:PAS domain S-box-containing protein